jgi:hypothetical protein
MMEWICYWRLAIRSGKGGDATMKQETWRGEVRQAAMWVVQNVYNPGLRASYKCGLSLSVSFHVEDCSKSARTRPWTMPSRYTRACGGFIFEMNIRVAARVACRDHCSGEVSARMQAHAGREGVILNGFGSGPAR